MRVYLDACCLARLTDDQSQPRIRREAEAVERVLFLVRHGSVVLISSEALRDEIGRNPSDERRLEGEALVSLGETTGQGGCAGRAASIRTRFGRIRCV